jgi:hypothetical protein
MKKLLIGLLILQSFSCLALECQDSDSPLFSDSNIIKMNLRSDFQSR